RLGLCPHYVGRISQSINNAKDITASGDVNATSFNGTYGRFAKNVNVSEDLNVIGFSTFGKNVSMNSQLTVKNGINSESYVSARTQASKLQIGGGGTSDSNMVLLNVSGGAGDGYLSLNGNNNSSVKLDIWGSQRVRGDLTLSGSNDGKTTGAISASGNISSEKTVSGEYLQPKSISMVGASCSPDGLISKDNKGATLSCQSGVWRENSGGLITLDGNTCSAGSEPVLYYASKAVFWGGQVRTNPYGDQKLWVPEYNINETQAHCTTSGGGEKGEKENCRTIPKYINITQVKCG
ncbi:shufflon system plasmid conjugative transfer pilus tip adhesin PilV, partial [Pectobacterium carotovorum]|uniref:shufflon system plasmid conjugative transfer pilus tip adhesin PilV n=1 Tax=Pectobacterium carotovorum TaxID=554 RepID=UPI0030177283